MASITRQGNGRRLIQFVAGDGKRKSIRLGKVPQRVAEEIRVKVEQLVAAAASKFPIDHETARWLAEIGDDLADKLAAVGLIPKRAVTHLGDFLASYIGSRTDVKPLTRRSLYAARTKLVRFFGSEKALRDVTPGDADAWLLWLKGQYAGGTTGRAIKFGKQFFRAAFRQRLIPENPFDDVKAPSQANEARKHFVSKDVAKNVLDACPDAEWRLIFALSRFGGVRCPSETLALRWQDVDWERDRFWVPSSKTESHEGHEGRWVPIFLELRPYLEDAFDQALDGSLHVISSYRDPSKNFRTRMLRIIHRAGLTPWPKLFHNLRATRETELAAEYPVHVVCAWIGNSALIAAKHYLQVTDDDYKRAAKCDAPALQNAVRQPAARPCNDSQDLPELGEGREFVPNDSTASDSLRNEKYARRDSNPQPMVPKTIALSS